MIVKMIKSVFDSVRDCYNQCWNRAGFCGPGPARARDYKSWARPGPVLAQNFRPGPGPGPVKTDFRPVFNVILRLKCMKNLRKNHKLNFNNEIKT